MDKLICFRKRKTDFVKVSFFIGEIWINKFMATRNWFHKVSYFLYLFKKKNGSSYFIHSCKYINHLYLKFKNFTFCTGRFGWTQPVSAEKICIIYFFFHFFFVVNFQYTCSMTNLTNNKIQSQARHNYTRHINYELNL